MKVDDIVLIILPNSRMEEDTELLGVCQKGVISRVVRIISTFKDDFRVSFDEGRSSCWVRKEYVKVLKVRRD